MKSTPQLYLGFCVAGLQEVAGAHLPEARIEALEEGLVVFSARPDPGPSAPFFNNLFCVMNSAEGQCMGDVIDALLANQKRWAGGKNPSAGRERTFRLTLSDNNCPVAGNRQQIGALISALERHTGLRYTQGTPDVTFWVFRRASGRGWLAKRLTYGRKTEKDLAPGTLRPELAHLLCLLSSPKETDVFLDPFAGSGAIPFARAAFPYNMIFASDFDLQKVKEMRNTLARHPRRLERKGNPLIIRAADAADLTKIENGFVDAIVTDPPWGLFDKTVPEEDLDRLYHLWTKEFCRVLKSGGHLVLLTGRRNIVPALTAAFKTDLVETKSYDILVSGKKARVACYLRV